MMAPYSASPRVGHIEALYNIFSYLMMHDESALAFDATKPDIDESALQQVDWKDFYGEVEEKLPPKMPEPLGRPVTISCFVDANHAGNVVTRWSHSGVLIFLINPADYLVFQATEYCGVEQFWIGVRCCKDRAREAFRQVEGAHVRRRLVPEVQIKEGRDYVSHGIHGRSHDLAYD